MSMILHLPLKKKWFDLINARIKKEEYREIKPYWIKRLLQYAWESGETPYVFDHMVKPIKSIRFRNGYTKKICSRKFKKLRIGNPNPEWCEAGNENKKVFIIEFE